MSDFKTYDFTRLIAQKIENPEIAVDKRPLMEAGIIPNPFDSVLFVGGTGSGKTNVLLNWMLDPEFYENYFDETYLFSTTADMDPLFKRLDIKKENRISSNIPAKLNEIMNTQKNDIEYKGVGEAKKTLLIFEDSTSAQKMLKSRDMTLLFTAGRHSRFTVFLIIHKYKSCPPVIRLNAKQLVLFPSNNGQLQQIYEDYAPSGVSKKSFYAMVRSAWTPNEIDVRPYLYIDNSKKYQKGYFRKGLYWALEPTQSDY